jgi:hypothetical protein
MFRGLEGPPGVNVGGLSRLGLGSLPDKPDCQGKSLDIFAKWSISCLESDTQGLLAGITGVSGRSNGPAL